MIGRNIFEYKEMLAIISRVRKKEREISLRYRRFIFPIGKPADHDESHFYHQTVMSVMHFTYSLCQCLLS